MKDRSFFETRARLLIIDDHAEFVAALSELITALYPRACVVHALDGRLGLNLALSEKPDLILLDAHMPVMDGYEAARALQAHPKTRTIPLIAMTLTGNDQSQILADLRPLCDTVLFKPFHARQLMAAMRQIGVHS